jgi:hypothetical protein
MHDIGRRFRISGMRHVLDGYQFLTELGYPGSARICMTHSYPIRHTPHGASPWDGSEEEWQFVANYLGSIEYDDYDRLIQLCDSFSLPDGFCLVEKRLMDVAFRYGYDGSSRAEGFQRSKNILKGGLTDRSIACFRVEIHSIGEIRLPNLMGRRFTDSATGKALWGYA